MSNTKSLPPTPNSETPAAPEASEMDTTNVQDRDIYSDLEVSDRQHSSPRDPADEHSSSDKPRDGTVKCDQHQGYIENDMQAAPMLRPMSYEGKISPYEQEGKILGHDHNQEKEAYVTESGPYPEEKSDVHGDQAPFVPEHKILGLKRRAFYILLIAILVVVIIAAVGGGVGGAAASRHSKPHASTASTPNATNASSAVLYANTGLAAMRWTDPNGTLYKRVYYQDAMNNIKESSWDNTTSFQTPWQINTIAKSVKPNTPIGAAAGWPHASYNYSLVKNVYYLSPTNEIVERQAQANNSQAWEDDNFTGLFSAVNNTFLQVYWGQNIYNTSEELVVVFQRDNFENGLTQARYISANDTSEPWVANNFPFAQPMGSTFTMSLISYRSGRHLMLYAVGNQNKVNQYEWTINDDEPVESTSVVALTSTSTTPLIIDPQAPLAVVAQDNQPLYTNYNITLPSCYQQTPLTHLIMYATSDSKALTLYAWNCTAGFQDHTTEIAPLQKPNTTFLSIAAMSDRATGDGNVYLMFDSGSGPEVEEWTVPRRAGDPWQISRSVDVDF